MKLFFVCFLRKYFTSCQCWMLIFTLARYYTEILLCFMLLSYWYVNLAQTCLMNIDFLKRLQSKNKNDIRLCYLNISVDKVSRSIPKWTIRKSFDDLSFSSTWIKQNEPPKFTGTSSLSKQSRRTRFTTNCGKGGLLEVGSFVVCREKISRLENRRKKVRRGERTDCDPAKLLVPLANCFTYTLEEFLLVRRLVSGDTVW